MPCTQSRGGALPQGIAGGRDRGGAWHMAARRLHALVQAAGTLLILAAGPVVLAWWAGWPLPRRWPHGRQWIDWLSQSPTVAGIRSVIVCLIWLLWAVMVAAVVVEAVRLLRGLRRPRLRLPSPLRALAAT